MRVRCAAPRNMSQAAYSASQQETAVRVVPVSVCNPVMLSNQPAGGAQCVRLTKRMEVPSRTLMRAEALP